MGFLRTADVTPATAGTRPVGSALRATRLASGLVLATYVTAHLANHALGIFSIDAQEALLDLLRPVWQSIPGTLLLYGALLVHAGLGLYALWRRKTLRMPAWELAQLSLGLAVPLLLIPHVFGTRVSQALVGTDATYHAVVAGVWDNPWAMPRLSAQPAGAVSRGRHASRAGPARLLGGRIPAPRSRRRALRGAIRARGARSPGGRAARTG
jgi:succinate dehydrogenase hydrophobic anchor subunit